MSFSPITHGDAVTQLRTAGFAVTEATYPALYDIPQHNHELASLTFVLRGGLAESVSGRTENLHARELLLKPPATEHSNHIGTRGARLLLVEVVDPHLVGPAVKHAFQRPTHVKTTSAAAPLLRVGVELERNDSFSCVCIEGLLLQLIGQLAREDAGKRPSAREPQYLRRTRERLHADFAKPLRISGLAADEGIAATRLAREFQRRYGCSIADYLRRLRLEQAMQGLSTSPDSISAIALQAGFADQSHLTRELRRATGFTPRRFREQTR